LKEKCVDQTEDQIDQDLTKWYHLSSAEEYALVLDAEPAVDLSIADSPVVSVYSDYPIRTMRTYGGSYILLHDEDHPAASAEVVSEARIRLMRARFLVRKGYYALYLDGFPYSQQQAILSGYFDGSMYRFPDPILKRARIGWRQHLRQVMASPPPPEGTVEGQIVRTLRSLSQDTKAN
jgi:hypothetical protein